MTTPEDLPEGFDPHHDVLLDLASLRALAHPLRVRLLGLLREHGPSTATLLGRRVGQSSGVTSYHLRQLALHGFVAEDVERGNQRERWWRAAHRSTWFDSADGGDPAVQALGEEYLRAVAGSYTERMARFLDGSSTFRAVMGPDWDDAWTLSDTMLALTPQQGRQVVEALTDVLSRFPAAEPGRPPSGRQRVAVQFQVLPQVPEAEVAVSE